MAKKPSPLKAAVQSVLNFGLGNIDLPKKTPGASDASALLSPSKTIISGDEREAILARVASAPVSRVSGKQALTESGITGYLSSVANAVAKTRSENLQILQMAPEIKQAADIVIPAIISPNDLRNASMSIRCDSPDLDTAQRENIAKILEKHFNEELKISAKLKDWIKEAMYLSGAKPILVIPISTLDKAFNDPSGMVNAVESYQKKVETKSVYGIADNAFTESNRVAVESIINGVTTDLAEAPEGTFSVGNDSALVKGSYHLQNSAKKELANAIKTIVSSEALTIVDDLDVVKINPLSNKAATKKLKKGIATQYKEAVVLSMDAPTQDEGMFDHPLMMELPTESVIPLYIPASPNEHLGYFILLDENGCPINPSEERGLSSISMANPERLSSFESMYRAYGAGDFQSITAAGLTKATGVYAMYERVIEHHLATRIQKAGYGNIRVGAMKSIYQYMFSRYLRGRKTRLLFVPKDFITYLCYDYDTNGTGRSKLEDIKFALALRITLLVASTLTALTNSIQHETVEVNFTENTTGHPLEILEAIKQESIRKRTWGISYDPEDIARGIAEKGISIKATGLSAMPNYSASSSPSDKNGVSIDSTLLEETKNLVVLGTEVPPSALNNLSENEFSRSIVGQNLNFSRKIENDQSITKMHLGDFVRTYTLFSRPLQEAILSVLRGEDSDIVDDITKSDEKSKKTTKGKGKDKAVGEEGTLVQSNLTASKSLYTIIQNLYVDLPTPNIAPNKAEIEELNGFASNMETTIRSMLPDDIAGGDDDIASALTVLRAHYLRLAINQHLDRSGIGDSLILPDLRNVASIAENLDVRDILKNLGVALKAQKEAFDNAMSTADDAMMSGDTSGADSGGDMDMGTGSKDTGGGGDDAWGDMM